MTPAPARAEEGIFARHLDLAQLRGRRRGRVLCIFHRDRTASLSVDLDRGLFNCFGCGAQGGVAKFTELVGEQAHGQRVATLSRARSTFEIALVIARGQRWYREETRLLYAIADAIRRRRRVVGVARGAATRAGDCQRSWNLLERAAVLETEVEKIEAELEEVFR